MHLGVLEEVSGGAENIDRFVHPPLVLERQAVAEHQLRIETLEIEGAAQGHASGAHLPGAIELAADLSGVGLVSLEAVHVGAGRPDDRHRMKRARFLQGVVRQERLAGGYATAVEPIAALPVGRVGLSYGHEQRGGAGRVSAVERAPARRQRIARGKAGEHSAHAQLTALNLITAEPSAPRSLRVSPRLNGPFRRLLTRSMPVFSRVLRARR